MDPLSLAVAHFHAELAAELSDVPTPSQDPPLPPPSGRLRLLVEHANPDEVLKALRLFEFREENRYPFFVLAEPFNKPDEYVAAAFEQIAADERIVREGLEEHGRTIPPTPAPLVRTALSLASWISAIAKAMAQELAGLILVLSPPRTTDPEGFLQLAQSLLAHATFPQLVVLVRDDVGGLDMVAPRSVTLSVDRKALLEHVKTLRGANQIGPEREGAPSLTGAQRKALELQTGRRVPSQDAALGFKRLILEAGEAQSEGNFEIAAKKFRMARTWCHMVGQRAEAVVCTLAIGTAQFSCGRTDRALEAYAAARAAAIQLGIKRLEIQADLGIATALYNTKQFGGARAAYERVAAGSLEPAGGMLPLRFEAIRMAAECFVEQGSVEDAVARLRAALAEIDGLSEELRAVVQRRVLAERLEVLCHPAPG